MATVMPAHVSAAVSVAVVDPYAVAAALPPVALAVCVLFAQLSTRDVSDERSLFVQEPAVVPAAVETAAQHASTTVFATLGVAPLTENAVLGAPAIAEDDTTSTADPVVIAPRNVMMYAWIAFEAMPATVGADIAALVARHSNSVTRTAWCVRNPSSYVAAWLPLATAVNPFAVVSVAAAGAVEESVRP